MDVKKNEKKPKQDKKKRQQQKQTKCVREMSEITVFWCFQGVEKECIENKWINFAKEKKQSKLIKKNGRKIYVYAKICKRRGNCENLSSEQIPRKGKYYEDYNLFYLP